MRIDSIVAKSKFVDVRGIKNMCLTHRHAAIRKIFVAVEKSSAVQFILKRRGNKTRLAFITEAPKDGVLAGKSVIDAYVEIVAGFTARGHGQVIKSRIV